MEINSNIIVTNRYSAYLIIQRISPSHSLHSIVKLFLHVLVYCTDLKTIKSFFLDVGVKLNGDMMLFRS